MSDKQVEQLIQAEATRQREGLELIASENYPSRAVLDALGSILSAKYAEGYPGKRYYGGNQVIDQIESLAIERAKKLFGAEHVNVQPYSGSPANVAAYLALLNIGDTFMGLSLTHGGHLTHGHKVSFTGQAFNAIQYEVDPKTGLIDYEAVGELAKEHKPKLIVSGTTAYPRVVDWERMQKIAQSVGALHMVDMSHVAGLVAGDVVPNPVPYADVVTTTTHKTLRGPRAAMIMCRKGFAKAIDRSVFPGLQGGPHENAIAGIAIALEEASRPDFKDYAKRVLENARTLAKALGDRGFSIVTGGTDTHLILVDLSKNGVTGSEAEIALEQVGITVNKNTVPGEKRSPMDPSGIRIGTAAITTRGVDSEGAKKVAGWIADGIEARENEHQLQLIAKEVKAFSSELTLPGQD